MGLLDFPNPVDWVASVKDDEQKRALVNSAASAAYSSWITFMWRVSTSRTAQWFGFTDALQAAAVAGYLSLRELERKNFLTLTIPSDLKSNYDLLSKFQTEQKTK